MSNFINNNYGVNAPNTFKKPRNENPAMSEENRKIIEGNITSVFELNEIDLVKALCTHKDANGTMLIDILNGTDENGFQIGRCRYCGETFPLMEGLSKEETTNIVNNVVYLLQIIKLYGVNINTKFLEAYSQMIPYIKQLPQIYELAMNGFQQINNNNNRISNNNNGFNFINNVVGGGINPLMSQNYNNNYQQPPMGMNQNYNNNYQQPPMGNNIYQQPPMGMDQNYNNNYQQPPMGNNGYGFNNNSGGYAVSNQPEFNSDPMKNANEFNIRNTNTKNTVSNKKAFED